MAPKNTHSPYSPSKSEIYFNCPGSVASQAEVARSASTYAAKAGQRAHFLGELCLKGNKPPEDFLFETLRDTDKNDTFAVTEQMVSCVDMYYRFVTNITATPGTFLYPEMRLEANIAGQEIYGTCDAVIVQGSMLHIVDYKHGGGHAVEAIGNKQMLIYALLASETIGEFTDYHLVIVQPNAGGEKEWYITAAELAQFKIDLENAILETLHNPDKLVPGDHCLWCEAKANCGAYSASATKVLGTRNGVIILPNLTSSTPEKLAEYIHNMSRFLAKARASLKTAEAQAESLLESGVTLPGLEMHEAKGRRAWVDQKAVMEKYKAFGERIFSKTLRSPADMEKTFKLPKTELESLGLTTIAAGKRELKKTWDDGFTNLNEETPE